MMVLFVVYCKYRIGKLEQSELIACTVPHISQTAFFFFFFCVVFGGKKSTGPTNFFSINISNLCWGRIEDVHMC